MRLRGDVRCCCKVDRWGGDGWFLAVGDGRGSLQVGVGALGEREEVCVRERRERGSEKRIL